LIKTTAHFTQVSVANPKVADVVVLSSNELYVYGLKPGYTSLVFWDKKTGKTVLDVVVSLDLTSLKEHLHELYRGQDIGVYGTESGVVLTGTVTGPEVVDQVLRLTQAYLPKLAEDDKGVAPSSTGRSGLGITNLLHVGGIQQVMLEVQFAEVTRTKGKDLQAALGLKGVGDSVTAALGVGGMSVGSNGTLTGASAVSAGSVLLNFANFATNPANIFVNIDDFTAALRLLEDEGLAKILAEPRLVTQSGQEASFLAGGEFPIPTVDAQGNVDIQFKEFGVSLQFTPTIMSNGLIGLRVAPTVSEVSSTTEITTGNNTSTFVVPNLSTRKLESTVQLYDGQTIALAGLLQDTSRGNLSKVPWLGDIPILGALFRSQAFEQSKTDLLVAVTPHLVKPMPEGSLRFPGDTMTPPGRVAYYLFGRLEGKPMAAPKAPHDFTVQGQPQEPEKGGLEGAFGPKSLQPQ